jgi:hypothetical protein
VLGSRFVITRPFRPRDLFSAAEEITFHSEERSSVRKEQILRTERRVLVMTNNQKFHPSRQVEQRFT